MATTIYEAIRSSLIALLKGRWPAFDVFGEGIDKTQEAGQTELEDYIYLDIIPSGNQPAGRGYTDRSILVDAAIHTKGESNLEYLQISQELDDLLRAANVISLHVPLNDSTRHMIDAARIAEMQDGAIVINTARGGLIDEAAAAEAIRSGKLGGLGLDAFEQEPLVDSPLKNLPHVIFTPHTGAHTGEAVAKMGMMSVENAIAVLKGEPCRFILK